MNQRSICAIILNKNNDYIKFANAYVLAINKNIINLFYTYYEIQNTIIDPRLIEINKSNLKLTAENFYNCLIHINLFPHCTYSYKINEQIYSNTSKINEISKNSINELLKKIILYEMNKHNKIKKYLDYLLFWNKVSELK